MVLCANTTLAIPPSINTRRPSQKALETVALDHKRAAKDLHLEAKVATVDNIRAAAAPTEAQMAAARDRIKNKIEADKNAEKYGIPQEAARNTKERTAPKRNPLMK